MSSNRRNYERLLIRRYALLKLANGEVLEGLTRDMSVGGAFIECEPDIDLSEGTECSINLALDKTEPDKTTEIYGTISHCSSDGLGFVFLRVHSTFYQFMGEASDEETS